MAQCGILRGHTSSSLLCSVIFLTKVDIHMTMSAQRELYTGLEPLQRNHHWSEILIRTCSISWSKLGLRCNCSQTG